MEIDIFDKNFDIFKMPTVGDLVAAFIMKLHESSARYNGENFYILKSDLELYLKDSDDWLPTILNEKFGLTNLDLTGFEFDKGDAYANTYDKGIKNKYANAEYVHVGKLKKYLNNIYG